MIDKKIYVDYPMKKSSYVQIGGKVDAKIEIYSIEECYKTLQKVHQFGLSYFVYGKSSI